MLACVERGAPRPNFVAGHVWKQPEAQSRFLPLRRQRFTFRIPLNPTNHEPGCSDGAPDGA